MDKFTLIYVGIGGFLGAISRYYIADYFKETRGFPIGTFTVNVLGSFLLGLLVTLSVYDLINNNFLVFAGIGFLGSFTTMSSFVIDTLQLSNTSIMMAFYNFIIMMLFVFVGGLSGRGIANLLVNNVI